MNIKHVLIFSCFSLLILVIGFVAGRNSSITSLDGALRAVSQQMHQKNTDSLGAPTQSDAAGEVKASAVAPTLTADQKAMLKSFGLDPNKITVTATMIACAEAKVGTARFTEIKNGATPSFLEGASLMTCYK